jgi:hypothetical protein
MKRFGIFLMIGSTGMALLLGVVTAVSAQQVPMDDAHIERIRSNCTDAKATMVRLHESDALLRVNRGQLYESVSTKLIANLNSRIALNRLDGGDLIKIASDYEQSLTAFRTSYQLYEQQLSQALGMDCAKQPVAFYDAVTSANDKRKTVYDAVSTLNKKAASYKEAFERFAAQYKTAASTVTSRQGAAQ